MTSARNLTFGAVAAIAALAVVVPASAQDETAPAEEAVPVEVDPNAPVDPLALPAEGEVAPAEEEVVAPIEDTVEGGEENPYGLQALWREGDYVSKSVLLILAIMSIGSWYIFITKFMLQSNLRGQAKTAARRFWSGKTIADGIDELSANSVYRKVAEDGLRAAEHHQKTLRDKISLYEWVNAALKGSVQDVAGGLQGGIAFLATVGSISPFVGLFGTVWGILKALISIGVAGQASIDKVAGPVGEALIMTALGLFVAVPAVASYNMLVRRNSKIVSALRHFSDDLEVFIVSGARMSDVRRK